MSIGGPGHLIQVNLRGGRSTHSPHSTFFYRCPTTGMKVQSWIAEDASESTRESTYVSTECLACRLAHLVNPSTGHVAGGDLREPFQ